MSSIFKTKNYPNAIGKCHPFLLGVSTPYLKISNVHINVPGNSVVYCEIYAFNIHAQNDKRMEETPFCLLLPIAGEIEAFLP